ncbi:uroporphyrinogen III synthase [Mesorhizobium sp. Root157]|uniref:uroporphyrinogen-III synthase n=1 Tax=Mesorhizobium sp. Root157 TaxID=1736477 RepID=UPI0006F80CFB|nr:uroporphyrinogen-III synthase [Mesorhizobium sp. Root157]KRA00152.1 uroporphyrinogen III synthase [Mesorhizobium sp. Root157]
MRRVLITRPEPGASRTAQKLAELGFEPVLLPLSDTRPLPLGPEAVPTGAATVAVTSANAIRHATPELLSRLSGLRCYAVGPKTAEAARAAGLSPVHEGPGDALALADQIATSFSGALVYLCGQARFAGFEDRLGRAGVRVHPLESYDTVSLEYSSEAVCDRLADRPVDALLLYSAKAAHAAGQLTARTELRHLFEGAGFFALSERIASALGPNCGSAVRVASRPTEPALLALLATLSRTASSHRPFSPL